jgi:hypothetical protein
MLSPHGELCQGPRGRDMEIQYTQSIRKESVGTPGE